MYSHAVDHPAGVVVVGGQVEIGGVGRPGGAIVVQHAVVAGFSIVVDACALGPLLGHTDSRGQSIGVGLDEGVGGVIGLLRDTSEPG